MASILSSLASYALPSLTKLYSSSQSTTTKYPGAASSPWLPGSNYATNKPLENATAVNGNSSHYNYGTGTGTTYNNNITKPATTSTPQTNIQQPNLKYDMPRYDTMSWEEAMSRARSAYQPLYEQSVLDRNRMTQDQRDYRSQALAAKGYGNRAGGKYENVQTGLTQQQAAALENLRNAYESQVSSAAMGLYDSSMQSANNRLANAISLQTNQNNAELGKWQTLMGMSENDKTRQSNEYNSALEFWLNILNPYDEE